MTKLTPLPLTVDLPLLPSRGQVDPARGRCEPDVPVAVVVVLGTELFPILASLELEATPQVQEARDKATNLEPPLPSIWR